MTSDLLQRIDALSDHDRLMILVFLAGYNPEMMEEQVARREEMAGRPGVPLRRMRAEAAP